MKKDEQIGHLHACLAQQSGMIDMLQGEINKNKWRSVIEPPEIGEEVLVYRTIKPFFAITEYTKRGFNLTGVTHYKRLIAP